MLKRSPLFVTQAKLKPRVCGLAYLSSCQKGKMPIWIIVVFFSPSPFFFNRMPHEIIKVYWAPSQISKHPA